VTVKEIIAAFVVDRIVDSPDAGFDQDRVDWARERLDRAGLTLRVTTPRDGRGLDGLPDLSTTWWGLAVRVRVVDHPDFRALVLVLSQTEVYRTAAREGDGYAHRAAEQFRDLCDAARPVYAFVQPVPVDDVPDFLDEVSTELLGLRLDRLAGFGFPLWYVDRAWATETPPGAPDLPAEHGVVIRDRAGWL
jgi:hypothetical protein